jgi:CRISPR/Cas system-associated exonuclease Cas4 (RecB family)
VELNPAQQSVIELLGRSADRPELPVDLIPELSAELNDELASLAADLDPSDPLFVSKHALTTIHTCEAHHVAGDGEFTWSVPAARGIVAHRAIEVMVHYRGEPYPGDLVDESLARLINDDNGVGQFLASMNEFDTADLRAFAVDKVSAFQESFPPLRAQWVPRTESKSRVDLHDGRIVLSGKTDLTLGRPGNKVIIDLKSGRVAAAHREDLRFYALLEAIKLGAAPRKLASYYLDSARTHPEDVSEGVLRAAVARTIDGVHRIAEVRRFGREPERRAGAQCRWCPLQADCSTGQEYLTAANDDD